MIKVILCGAAGRMGNEIIKAAQHSSTVVIQAGIEARGHSSVGSEICGIDIVDDINKCIDEADCVVDFTYHSVTIQHMKTARKHKKPYVTGTTGFTEEETTEIEAISNDIPVFMGANMSLGVNCLYSLVRDTIRRFPHYDIDIIETHHKYKKDAPSGTAKSIANIILEEKPETILTYGRKGMTGERNNAEVSIHAVRGGDVVGEHRVLFLGDGEFIELRHYATSRRCFAEGTLRAVRFIMRKPAGLYTMKHLLK